MALPLSLMDTIVGMRDKRSCRESFHSLVIPLEYKHNGRKVAQVKW
jgi:hypothetical protein